MNTDIIYALIALAEAVKTGVITEDAARHIQQIAAGYASKQINTQPQREV
jgi:hypothetical protein